MAMCKFSKSSAALPLSVREFPPFLFIQGEKIDKVDGTETDKSA
jgi:hypothetical protein